MDPNAKGTRGRTGENKAEISLLFLTYSALHFAAWRGYVDVVSFLLQDPRIDSSVKNAAGETGKRKKS